MACLPRSRENMPCFTRCGNIAYLRTRDITITITSKLYTIIITEKPFVRVVSMASCMWSSLIQKQNYNLYFKNNNIHCSPFPLLIDESTIFYGPYRHPFIHWLDSGASCRVTICRFVSECVRSVRRAVHAARRSPLLTLVHAFITSRVDHCNGVLYGSNGYLLDRLQSFPELGCAADLGDS